MSGGPADTIVAPATPVGRSALAIVRIDGPQSAAILQALGGSGDAEERHAAFVHLRHDGELLDECVAIRYAAPRSFTGNDLVELTLHGNPLLVQRVIEACVALGARMAEPGEFTERAVLNGKLDLVQAESIAELINARTPLQARLSLSNLDGALSRTAASIRERLLYVISRLEAALDFSEEGYEFITRDAALVAIDEAQAALGALADSFRRGQATVRGLDAVILGRPNAGKSTLMNRLVGSERAIVTPVPGTTRDIVRETIEIGGLPVTLADTAGLRESDDLVEGIGIGRARDAARRADIILYVIDATDPHPPEPLDSEARTLTVYTKIDLAPAPNSELGVSVPTGVGVTELLSRLDQLVKEEFAAPESSAVLINDRQRAAVMESQAALTAARASLQDGLDEQVVLVDLYRAATSLGVLTGTITRDDVFSEIFTKFCIGK